MNFLEPMGLIGLSALVPIIALYFLKLKREERVVPSTLLWKKVLDDMQVNAPFQRLKYSLLLLLQLLLVALLGFAMARPYLSLSGYAGKKIILLIDTSASMSTKDCGTGKDLTRLEAAVKDAMRKAEDLRDNDEMMVVAFDKDVRQLCKFMNDRTLLKNILANLQTRDVATNANEAFETALALAEGKTDAEIVVLSDGCFGDVKIFKEKEEKKGNLEDRAAKGQDTRNVRRDLSIFRFKSYGAEKSDNVAITQMDARTRPVKATNADGQKVDALETQVFVMVENFSPEPKDVILSLSTPEQRFPPKSVALKGRPIIRETLDSTPASGDTSEVARSVEVFKLPIGTQGIVTAHIDAPKDRMSADDTASLVVGTAGTIKLLLVTKGDLILEKALAAIRGLDITKMAPEDFLKQWDQKGQPLVEPYDACLFEDVAPVAWTDGGALFLNSLPPVSGFAKEEKLLEWPTVVDWDVSHPAMRYVNFGNVTISKAQNWKTPKNSKIMVEGSGGPLAVSFENDRLRVVGVAFDVLASDWAYRPSLPLFLRNVIPWVAESSPRRRPSSQQTGDPLVVPPSVNARTATVIRPKESNALPEHIELSLEHSTYIKGTETAGIYSLKDIPNDPEGRTYAVNLASRTESDNAARSDLSVEGVKMTSTPTAIEAKREIWNTLALIAAGLLLIEWWVYHRRVGI